MELPSFNVQDNAPTRVPSLRCQVPARSRWRRSQIPSCHPQARVASLSNAGDRCARDSRGVRESFRTNIEIELTPGLILPPSLQAGRIFSTRCDRPRGPHSAVDRGEPSEISWPCWARFSQTAASAVHGAPAPPSTGSRDYMGTQPQSKRKSR
jgi:hypothetical protein